MQTIVCASRGPGIDVGRLQPGIDFEERRRQAAALQGAYGATIFQATERQAAFWGVS